MKSKNTTQTDELVEYIDRTIAGMRSDKKHIDFYATFLAHNNDPLKRIAWELAHFQGSWLETIRNLERLQKGLKELNDK